MTDVPGVLVVTDAYPPDCGGSGWSTHALVTALRGAGHEVEVVRADGSLTTGAASHEYDGVTVRSIGLRAYRGPVRHVRVADYSLEPVRQAVAEILAGRPDLKIVHGQHLHSAPGAALAARDAGCAALATLRDYWPVRLDGIAYPDDEANGNPRTWARRALTASFGLGDLPASVAASRALQRLDTRQRALNACRRILCVSDAIRRRAAPHVGPRWTSFRT